MGSLVDQWGRPIQFTSKTQKPQTDDARFALLKQHYSEHPSSGLTPVKLAGIMQQAEQGDLIAQCELAEDMEEKDAHIQSELSKRRRAVLNYSFKITPSASASDTEKRDAEFIAEVLQHCDWLEDVIFDLSDAILKGFAACEFTWQLTDGYQLPVSCDWRDPAWFQMHPDHRNQLMLRDGSHTGQPLQQFGWVLHRTRSKSGYISRQGLVRTLAWPFLFKNYSVRDLAEFLEIYGLPIRVGKYPEGATEREKMTLLQAVMSIGHNAGGIIPRGMEIEFQRAVESGSSGEFLSMIDWCEKSVSKAILGGTLTSQADGKTSTNALGNVHNDVRIELAGSDAKQIAATLTRDLVYPLYAINCKSHRSPLRYPKFEFDFTEAEDLTAFSQSLPNLVDVGVQIPVAWVSEKLQIPQPKSGEPVLIRQQQPAGFNASLSSDSKNTCSCCTGRSVATLSANRSDTCMDSLDAALRALEGESDIQTQAETVLLPIIRAIKDKGAEAAIEQMAALWPEMGDDELIESLSRVMFVAETWGRLNALD